MKTIAHFFTTSFRGVLILGVANILGCSTTKPSITNSTSATDSMRQPAQIYMNKDGSIEIPVRSLTTTFDFQDPHRLSPIKNGLDYYLADHLIRDWHLQYPVLANSNFEDLLQHLRKIDTRLGDFGVHALSWEYKGKAGIEAAIARSHGGEMKQLPLNDTSLGYRYIYVSNPRKLAPSREPFNLAGHRYIEFRFGIQSQTGLLAKRYLVQDYSLKLVEDPRTRTVVVIVNDFHHFHDGTSVPHVHTLNLSDRDLTISSTALIEAGKYHGDLVKESFKKHHNFRISFNPDSEITFIESWGHANFDGNPSNQEDLRKNRKGFNSLHIRGGLPKISVLD